MPLRDLRPQAERASRRAAAPGVHRNVRILAVRTVVLQVVEVFFVNLGHERQLVEFFVGERGPVGIVMLRAILLIADSADRAPVAALRHFEHRVVEFLARRDIDRRRQFQRLLRPRRRMSADHRDDRIRIRRLDCFRGARVHPERRRRGVNHDQVVILRLVDRHLDRVIVRRRVEQPRARNHPGRIRQPRRDTKMTRPRASPGNVNRHPRRSHRTRADSGKVFSLHPYFKHTLRLSDWLVTNYTNRDHRRQQCGDAKGTTRLGQNADAGNLPE